MAILVSSDQWHFFVQRYDHMSDQWHFFVQRNDHVPSQSLTVVLEVLQMLNFFNFKWFCLLNGFMACFLAIY